MSNDIQVDLERMTIQIEEPDSVGNSISFGPSYKENKLSVEIDNPWSGSTETGFGETAHITLTKEQAKALGEFLLHFASQSDV